ncbi:hypothetical protein B0T16DRAFT_293620, partial [Cercophora newfieldiana]
MDDNRDHRKNEPPRHPSSNPQYYQSLHEWSQRRDFTGSHGDRIWPAPLSTPSAGTAREMGGSSASYSPQGAFPTTATRDAMSYHHTPTGARQVQDFTGTYNPIMYDVPQAAGPQSTTAYDTSQQYSSRQPAEMQMMATDVAAAPYFSSEAANTAGTTALQGQTGSSAASQVYQQPSLQSYSSGSMGSMGGMAAQSAQAQDVRMDEEYPDPEGLDAAYASYQSTLKAIFQNIQDGSLASASESLLGASDWLLSHVAELGLTSDDQNHTKLWNDLNHAWLGILQAQKDMMESGQQTQRSQSLILQEGLERMGKELVWLCDSIERHGLPVIQFFV